MPQLERVFLDANILIEASYPASIAFHIVIQPDVACFTSSICVHEITNGISLKVLKYAPVVRGLMTQGYIALVTTDYVQRQNFRYRDFNRYVGHPADAQVVASAAAVDCACILTRDHKFKTKLIQSMLSIAVLTPEQFLATYPNL